MENCGQAVSANSGSGGIGASVVVGGTKCQVLYSSKSWIELTWFWHPADVYFEIAFVPSHTACFVYLNECVMSQRQQTKPISLHFTELAQWYQFSRQYLSHCCLNVSTVKKQSPGSDTIPNIVIVSCNVSHLCAEEESAVHLMISDTE